jgi:hypothetical protein
MAFPIRHVAGGIGVGALMFLTASPAAAQSEPPNSAGPCQAQATLSNGVVVDPYVSSGVYEIPLSGSAQYSGAVTAAVTPPRPISGEIYIDGPLGAKISVFDDWSWSNDSSELVDKSGSVDWDLPSWLPRGTELTVSGVHNDVGFVCEGSVTLELEGGFFDSPLGAVAVVGTVLTGLGLAGALVAKAGGL